MCLLSLVKMLNLIVLTSLLSLVSAKPAQNENSQRGLLPIVGTYNFTNQDTGINFILDKSTNSPNKDAGMKIQENDIRQSVATTIKDIIDLLASFLAGNHDSFCPIPLNRLVCRLHPYLRLKCFTKYRYLRDKEIRDPNCYLISKF